MLHQLIFGIVALQIPFLRVEVDAEKKTSLIGIRFALSTAGGRNLVYLYVASSAALQHVLTSTKLIFFFLEPLPMIFGGTSLHSPSYRNVHGFAARPGIIAGQ